jgi:hypothetical protein
MNPVILVECKSFNYKLDKQAFSQLMKYNLTINAGYLVLTNGHQSRIFKRNAGSSEYSRVGDIPENF